MKRFPLPEGAGAVGLVLVVFFLDHIGAPEWLVWFLGVVGAMLIAGRVAYSWRHRKGPTPEAVKEECADLSRDIYEFLGDRKRDDPTSAVGAGFGAPPGATEVERERAFDEYTEKSLAHSNETMNRYKHRYSARALGLFDRAVSQGLANPGDRDRFERPTNPLGIEEVARILGSIGEAN